MGLPRPTLQTLDGARILENPFHDVLGGTRPLVADLLLLRSTCH